ncbi:putative orphan protein [Pseudoalteromonas luteoviolacea B = ATCC 29581]|nr:putative orphan protein [Pseudoalteromonas luteoviolacea B = ATCC 29581]
MKKFLLLMVIVLVFFTVDHPMIKEHRDTLLGEGMSVLGETSQLQHSMAAKVARSEIERQLSLSESEHEYIQEALLTNKKLDEFYIRYCEREELNLYFYEDRLAVICDIVQSSLQDKK